MIYMGVPKKCGKQELLHTVKCDNVHLAVLYGDYVLP